MGKSTPPSAPTRTVECDTSNVLKRASGRLKRGENNVNFATGGGGDWPLDSLLKVVVNRVLGIWNSESAGPAEGMMGHIFDFDFFTKQTRIRIKSYNDPCGVVIFINEENVYEWWQSPDDIPSKEHYREYLSQMDGAWADFANLRPGDECVEGEFGVEVVRADDGTDWNHCHRCGKELPDNEAPWEPICDGCYIVVMREKDAAAVVDDDPILEEDDDEIEWED